MLSVAGAAKDRRSTKDVVSDVWYHMADVWCHMTVVWCHMTAVGARVRTRMNFTRMCARATTTTDESMRLQMRRRKTKKRRKRRRRWRSVRRTRKWTCTWEWWAKSTSPKTTCLSTALRNVRATTSLNQGRQNRTRETVAKNDSQSSRGAGSTPNGG